MRYVVLYMLLALLGAFLLFYSFSQLPLLDWQALSTLLEQRQIETQSQAVTMLLELYRRGLLTGYLDLRSVLAVAAGIGTVVSGSVGAVHLLIDKLFFRKFYMPPNYRLALRRSLFWAAVAILIYALAVLNFLQLVVLFSILIIALILEVVMSGMGRKQITPDQPSMSPTRSPVEKVAPTKA